MRSPIVPQQEVPVMTDLCLSYIQEALRELSWLDYAFGKVQKLVKTKNGASYFYPAVYQGNNEYVSLLPDSGLGNFSFFVVDDPQTVEFFPHVRNRIKLPVSLIVWYDVTKVNPLSEDRNTERVKAELLRLLTDMTLKYGSFSITNIYEKAENIYKDFSLKEVDNQFMMHPYAGIRFQGEVIYNESC